MTRAQLRLAILGITFHIGKSVEHNVEIARMFEEQYFGDLNFPSEEGADAAPVPTPKKKASA